MDDDELTFQSFENEQTFEDYLIMSGFNGWNYFQENIITTWHQTVGLFADDNLVSAIKFHASNSGKIYIYAMQTREDLQNHGYGKALISHVIKNYKHPNGIIVKLDDKSLRFWLSSGFQLCDDLDVIVL